MEITSTCKFLTVSLLWGGGWFLFDGGFLRLLINFYKFDQQC